MILMLCALSMLFPYSGDDWAWGSQIGMERIRAGFVDYNGRYLGNIVVLVLTRNLFFRPLVVSTILVGIAHECARFVGKRETRTFILALILILLLPARVRAQALVWTSGFTNYAIPVYLTLLSINVCYCRIISENTTPCSKRTMIGMAVLGLCNSLFIENVTTFNVALGIILIIFIRIKQHRWDHAILAYLIGSTLGAALMFSNGAYRQVVSGESSYQQISSDSPMTRLTNEFANYLSVFCWGLHVCLAMVFVFSTSVTWANDSVRKRFWKVAQICLALALVGVGVYASFLCESNDVYPLRWPIALTSFFATNVLITSYCLSRFESYYAKASLFILLCSVILTVPLFAVSPIGPRNFFMPYVFECLIVLLIWTDYVVDSSNMTTITLFAILLAVIVGWTNIYLPIHRADIERHAVISRALHEGKQGVTISELPDPKHENVHVANPTKGVWGERFKLFYGYPDDLEITLK